MISIETVITLISDNTILVTIFLIPVVIGLLWRVNASHLFFSVMAGELLARYLGEDVRSWIGTTASNPVLAEYADILLILTPVILTAIFLKKSVKRRYLVLHVIPFCITGIVFGVFVVPSLPDNILSIVKATFIGDRFLHIGNLIIGIVIVTQLITLWIVHHQTDEKRTPKE